MEPLQPPVTGTEADIQGSQCDGPTAAHSQPAGLVTGWPDNPLEEAHDADITAADMQQGSDEPPRPKKQMQSLSCLEQAPSLPVREEGHVATPDSRRSKTLEFVNARGTAVVNPAVWWRHPLARMFVTVLVLILDMYLYGEDPINDARVEANYFGLGHLFAFCFVWPSSAGMVSLRLLLQVFSVVAGCVLGRQMIHHWFLRDKLKMLMFRDCNGTWFVMFPTVLVFMLASCFVFNAFADPEDQIDGSVGMQIRHFAKILQIGSISVDVLAIVMTLDVILQDRTVYPDFALGVKRLWCDVYNGWVRVIAAWTILVVTALSFAIGIILTGKDTGGLNWDESGVFGLSDSLRAFLVSFIIFCDLIVIIQDWEFPTFESNFDVSGKIYIAGTFSTTLKCACLASLLEKLPSPPACLRPLLPGPEFFNANVTGKWMTYGPLMGIIAVDLFCMRAQVLYEPSAFRQYTDPEGRIWTIVDEAFLDAVYEKGVLKESDRSLVTFEARSALSNSSDNILSATYTGSWFKYVAALPGFCMIVGFFVLAWRGNNEHTDLWTAFESYIKAPSTSVAAGGKASSSRCCCFRGRSRIAPVLEEQERGEETSAEVEARPSASSHPSAPGVGIVALPPERETPTASARHSPDDGVDLESVKSSKRLSPEEDINLESFRSDEVRVMMGQPPRANWSPEVQEHREALGLHALTPKNEEQVRRDLGSHEVLTQQGELNSSSNRTVT